MRLRDLISEFGGFVLDQYGVLHDGVALTPARSRRSKPFAQPASAPCC